jgi:fibronectin type 3 domain-containing protein
MSLAAGAPASGSGIALSWRPPMTGPVTGYRIYRGTSPFALAPLTVAGNVTSFTDQATTRGVYYFYVVRAVNAAGESTSSNLAYTSAR